jgi:hypothetical protein
VRHDTLNKTNVVFSILRNGWPFFLFFYLYLKYRNKKFSFFKNNKDADEFSFFSPINWYNKDNPAPDPIKDWFLNWWNNR